MRLQGATIVRRRQWREASLRFYEGCVGDACEQVRALYYFLNLRMKSSIMPTASLAYIAGRQLRRLDARLPIRLTIMAYISDAPQILKSTNSRFAGRAKDSSEAHPVAILSPMTTI